jgi:hypothetical protein
MDDAELLDDSDDDFVVWEDGHMTALRLVEAEVTLQSFCYLRDH